MHVRPLALLSNALSYKFNPLSRRRYVKSVIKSSFSNPVIAEVGVFEGDLSFSTLLRCNPSELLLIDPYAIYEGNKNDETQKSQDRRYENLLLKAKNHSNITVLRSSLSSLHHENYFSTRNLLVDVFYIDGDHSFEGALSDLEVSAKYLSPKGLIVIDDYFIGNPHYGIIKAVNLFLSSHPTFYIHGLNYNQLVLSRDPQG